MKERLLELINVEKLSSSVFADEIGVQRSSVSHILSGRNKPGYDFLQKILIRFNNLNANWLINGDGSMYLDKTSNDLFSPMESLDDDKNYSKSPTPVKEELIVKDDHKYENDNSKIQPEKIIIFYSDGSYKEFQLK